MRPRLQRNTEASVLILLLLWMSAVLVMTATLFLVAIKTERTQSLWVHQRQAYWLARGEARSIVKSLTQHVPNTTSWTHDYAVGRVNVVLTPGTDWQAKIVATVEESVDTLTFTYSPVLHVFLSWKDNGAG